MDFYSDKGGEWTNFYHRQSRDTAKLKFEDSGRSSALKATS